MMITESPCRIKAAPRWSSVSPTTGSSHRADPSLRSGDSLLSSSTLSLHRLFYRTRIFPVKKESQSPSFLSLSFFTGGSLSPDSGSSAPQASPPRSLPVSFPSSLFCDGCAFLPHTEKAQKCPLCLSKRHTLRIDQRDRIMGRIFQRDHAQAAARIFLIYLCEINSNTHLLLYEAHDRVRLRELILDIRCEARPDTAVIECFIRDGCSCVPPAGGSCTRLRRGSHHTAEACSTFLCP